MAARDFILNSRGDSKMVYDKVITGNIVLEETVKKGSIGIKDGVIANISFDEKLKGATEKNLENELIFPGAIDVHVHCFSNPKEGFEKTTRLAAKGGVTTFLDMPYDLPNPINNADIFKEKSAELEKEALVDIGLWGTMKKRGGTSDLKPMIEAGAMSFKMSTFETDEYRFPEIPNDEIIKAMKVLADTGVLVAFHSEDNETVKTMVEEYQDSNKIYNLAHNETRPPHTETTAVLKLLEYAYWTKAKLHIVHVSHPRTLDLIKQFRKEGVDVTAETCYPYLLLNTDDLKEYGPACKMNPPVRTKEDVARMWDHLKEGTIDLISSDHIRWEEEDKKQGYNNIFKAPSGLPGLEVIVPLIYDAMVNKHNFSPTDFGKLMATNAAERFQINGKGKIAVDYDADFVIINPETEWTVSEDSLETNINLLPFKNRKLCGKVTETIIRGETVFDGKEITVKPGYGKFIEGSGVL